MGQLGRLYTPDLYDAAQQGLQDGRADFKRKTIQQYVQPALGGDQGALAKIYGVDPQAGMQVQQQYGKIKEDSQQQLADFTRTVSALAAKGDMQAASDYYRTHVGSISQATGMELGPELQERMLPHIQNVAEALNPEKQQPLMNIGNGTVFDPNKREAVYTAPQPEPKEPDSIRELRLLQQNPDLLGVKERLAAAGRAPVSEGGKAADWQVMQQQDGTLVRVNRLSGEVAPVTLSGKPVAGKASASGGQVVQNPDGSTTIIPGGKPNTQELNNVGFYQRMVKADQELDGITGKGYDPTNIKDNATVGRTLTNWLASDEGQQYHQAAMNWIRANLRKESGAAIGKEEAAQEYANYFPQVGDSKDVIAQKARNRKVVEEAMRTATGPALGRQAQPQQAAATNDADPLGIL